MPSKILNAVGIIQRGIFDNLSTFDELERRISELGDENTKLVGDAFEIFVEALLATQAKYMAEEIWLVGQVPSSIRKEMNLPNDTKGIDGIFRTRTGTLVPYQVKFRSNRNYLTYTEIASFLGLTERASDRIVFTNSNEIANDAKNRDAMRSVRGGDFDELGVDDFRAIEFWLKEKPYKVVKPLPRDYQVEAIEAICSSLEKQDRTTAVMACGTGKTLVALWVAERLKSKTILVLMPSLTLLQQTLSEWSRHNSWSDHFTYICVCSDPTVTHDEKFDSIKLHSIDVDFPVTTDPRAVERFLYKKNDHVKVVFSTYQSSDILIQASMGSALFDIAVFDEAHKTTGAKDSNFSQCLSDERIKIRKRLFFTATPRHYDIRNRKRDGEIPVISMDDETIYGNRAYTLSFSEASRRGIICDYRVVISLVDGSEISKIALDQGITIIEGDVVAARWVATQIAVERAIQNTGSSRIITFHSRVSKAIEFSSDTSRGIKKLLPDFETYYVSGSQKSSERKNIIKEFRQAEKSIISNSRCLTEGIDIPAVDMVVFADPRQSHVDIAQAIGRAMRKPNNSEKKFGYVVIPIFIDRRDNKTLEEALDSSEFSAIKYVLNAMQEQDEDLVQIIREANIKRGRGEKVGNSVFKDITQFHSPSIDLAVLEANIFSEIVESIGFSWDYRFGQLLAFKKEHGHTRVPKNDQSGKRSTLYNWTISQRAKRETMRADLRQRLDSIGFRWSPEDDPFSSTYEFNEPAWNASFNKLAEFQKEHGHTRVPKNDQSGKRSTLYNWTIKQRADRYIMRQDLRQRLDSIGFRWITNANN